MKRRSKDKESYTLIGFQFGHKRLETIDFAIVPLFRGCWAMLLNIFQIYKIKYMKRNFYHPTYPYIQKSHPQPLIKTPKRPYMSFVGRNSFMTKVKQPTQVNLTAIARG